MFISGKTIHLPNSLRQLSLSNMLERIKVSVNSHPSTSNLYSKGTIVSDFQDIKEGVLAYHIPDDEHLIWVLARYAGSLVDIEATNNNNTFKTISRVPFPTYDVLIPLRRTRNSWTTMSHIFIHLPFTQNSFVPFSNLYSNTKQYKSILYQIDSSTNLRPIQRYLNKFDFWDMCTGSSFMGFLENAKSPIDAINAVVNAVPLIMSGYMNTDMNIRFHGSVDDELNGFYHTYQYIQFYQKLAKTFKEYSDNIDIRDTDDFYNRLATN